MKNRLVDKFLILVFFLFSFSLVEGQSKNFSVLISKGNNQYKHDGIWYDIKVGTTLDEDDLIKVDDDAFVGLIHKGGSTISLSEEKTYSLKQLRLNRYAADSRAYEYAQYYLDRLDASAPPSRLTRSVTNSPLRLMLPNSVNVYNPEVIIRWNAARSSEQYELVLKNMFDETLQVRRTADNRCTIDLNAPQFSDERLVIVRVQSEGGALRSDDYALKLMSRRDARQIKTELISLKQELKNEEEAVNQLIIASFYEKNNLLIDAITSYEQAINTLPNVEGFQVAYQKFLLRNGLSN
jgi:hypothetical protein